MTQYLLSCPRYSSNITTDKNGTILEAKPKNLRNKRIIGKNVFDVYQNWCHRWNKKRTNKGHRYRGQKGNDFVFFYDVTNQRFMME